MCNVNSELLAYFSFSYLKHVLFFPNPNYSLAISFLEVQDDTKRSTEVSEMAKEEGEVNIREEGVGVINVEGCGTEGALTIITNGAGMEA